MPVLDPSRHARMRGLVRIDALGLAACIALVGFMAWLAKNGTPLGEVAWMTVGGLINHFAAGLLTAHNYEFGSSAGSQAKDIRARLDAPEPEEPPK